VHCLAFAPPWCHVTITQLCYVSHKLALSMINDANTRCPVVPHDTKIWPIVEEVDVAP
jgi:hypothetical protein